MKIPTLIIDDESLARQRIKNLLKDISEIEVIEECKNGKQAIARIKETKPKLIFLDIQMKDMTGFEVLQKLSPKELPVTIFVTAYDNYALKAFDFFALDYLLKPYKDERFYLSVKKAIQVISSKSELDLESKINDLVDYINNTKNRKLKYGKSGRLPIKLGNKVSFINTSEIKYITASGYYAEIHVNEKKFLLREPLTNLIELLDQNNFARIHRSTIININELNEVISSNYGELDVKMNDNKLFRISKSYKKEFVELMKL